MLFTFKNTDGGVLRDDRDGLDTYGTDAVYIVDVDDERAARRHLATRWWRRSGINGARLSTAWTPVATRLAAVQFERDRAADRRARFEALQVKIALDSDDPAVRRATVLKHWWAAPNFDGGVRYTCGRCALAAHAECAEGRAGFLAETLVEDGYAVAANHPGRVCDACGTKSGGAAAVGGAS